MLGCVSHATRSAKSRELEVPHRLESATSGRSKCRACGRAILRGELRFGECLPNPFADGKEMTLWFHPLCAAYKRPEPLLQALMEEGAMLSDRERLERSAREGLVHGRLPRIDGAERSPSGQAACRHCRQSIERGDWRIRLVFFEEGLFSPGGFVHLACGRAYFECDDILDRLLHFSASLSDEERAELREACTAGS